jgi:hypothetical protein
VNICVRKRPINAKEVRKNDHDIVTCNNPQVSPPKEGSPPWL